MFRGLIGNLARWLAVGSTAALLASCGGGGSCSDSFGGTACEGGGGGGTPTPTASELVLVLSAPSVSNDGSEQVAAVVTALNGNRNAMPGVPVTVSVNNGGIATTPETVTDDAGELTALVGIGSDRTNRTITVTATSGSLTQTAQLQVTDTGGVSAAPADLILVVSSPTIVNTGAETVTATVTALDAKRNVLPGAGVTITVNNDATVAPSGQTTNAAGVVTAAIGIGGNPTNRTITVTAVAGSLTRTASIQVTDTPTTSGPVAADLSLTLSAPGLTNGGTNTILATATAVDSNRNALPGIPITFRVDASAVAQVSGTTTNANGVVTANVGIGADRSNRVVTVTASSGALTRTASFVVTGARLTASLAPLVDTGSTGNQIEYTLVDTNANPMAGESVTVTSPSLPTQSGTTNLNGKFVYTYDAPGRPGSIDITATAAGDTRTDAVSVQIAGGGTVPNAPRSPTSASVTPSPSVVTVNSAGSTTNQVELRALFVGANNQPIQNIRVRFDLASNVNSSDGVVSWLGGNYAYSDATGVARGTFTPGQRSSPTNGVTIRACYDTMDFAVNTCPNSVESTLTVTSEALSVNIRTNELIKSGEAELTYIKEFVVMVVDSAGQAKADVQITPSVDLTGYYKGFYFWNGDVWQQQRMLADSEVYSWNGSAWEKVAGDQPVCPNEDVNRNGIRDAGVVVAGNPPPGISQRAEDLNWNGDLDPRKADVAIKMVGSSRTDANGLAILQIEYGRNLATWVDFVITVTASGVSGTEARAKYVGNLYGLGNLPAPGEAVSNENVFPAFGISPYGRGFTGDVVPVPPDGVCTDTE